MGKNVLQGVTLCALAQVRPRSSDFLMLRVLYYSRYRQRRLLILEARLAGGRLTGRARHEDGYPQGSGDGRHNTLAGEEHCDDDQSGEDIPRRSRQMKSNKANIDAAKSDIDSHVPSTTVEQETAKSAKEITYGRPSISKDRRRRRQSSAVTSDLTDDLFAQGSTNGEQGCPPGNLSGKPPPVPRYDRCRSSWRSREYHLPASSVGDYDNSHGVGGEEEFTWHNEDGEDADEVRTETASSESADIGELRADENLGKDIDCEEILPERKGHACGSVARSGVVQTSTEFWSCERELTHRDALEPGKGQMHGNQQAGMVDGVDCGGPRPQKLRRRPRSQLEPTTRPTRAVEELLISHGVRAEAAKEPGSKDRRRHRDGGRRRQSRLSQNGHFDGGGASPVTSGHLEGRTRWSNPSTINTSQQGPRGTYEGQEAVREYGPGVEQGEHKSRTRQHLSQGLSVVLSDAQRENKISSAGAVQEGREVVDHIQSEVNCRLEEGGRIRSSETSEHTGGTRDAYHRGASRGNERPASQGASAPRANVNGDCGVESQGVGCGFARDHDTKTNLAKGAGRKIETPEGHGEEELERKHTLAAGVSACGNEQSIPSITATRVPRRESTSVVSSLRYVIEKGS